jgi:hypothetical protein
MNPSWQAIDGIVERGHQVASGTAADSPYPGGTIAMQIPFFKGLGLDLSPYGQGTLNISIRPNTFQINHPEFTFRQVEWTDRHPPEDFSFSRCRILFQGNPYPGWIYYPHPETKQRNFQNPTTIEVIALPIAGIRYGDSVKLEYNSLEITVDGV